MGWNFVNLLHHDIQKLLQDKGSHCTYSGLHDYLFARGDEGIFSILFVFVNAYFI